MGFRADGGAGICSKLLLLLTVLIQVSGELIVKDIPNGILKTEAEICQIGSLHQVVVVYADVHGMNWNRLTEEARRITSALDNLPSPVGEKVQRSKWLQRIKGALSRESLRRHRRGKRGLLNIVGTISHALFGTATDGQIKVLQDAVNDNRHAMQKVTRYSNKLITVVNQTWHRMEQLDIDHRNLADAVSHLQLWAKHMNEKVYDIKNLRYYNTVDQAVEMLEAHAESLVEWTRNWEEQQEQAARGRLSQILLSTSQLHSLLQGDSAGVPISPLQWYYENVKIKPLWFSDDLTFLVTLPLAKSCEFGLKISVYPVLVSENISSKLLLPELWLPTQGVIMMNHCMGNSPYVCRPLPEVSDRCIEAVLENGNVTSQCTIEVQNQNQKLFVTELNHVTLLTTGENISEICSHNTEPRYLEAGTYSVQWNGSCLLQTAHHRVPGIFVRHNYSLIHSMLWEKVNFTLDIVNLTQRLHPLWIKKLDLYNPGQVIRLPLNSPLPTLSDVIWKSDDDDSVMLFVKKNAFSMILLTILITIIVAIFVHKRVCKSQPRSNVPVIQIVDSKGEPNLTLLTDGVELDLV